MLTQSFESEVRGGASSPWVERRLSRVRAASIVALLGAELALLIMTGGSTSALLPLLMLPPLLGALRFRSEAETRLWFSGTFGVVAFASLYELTRAPSAINTGLLAITTTAAVALGYSGARHLRASLFSARERARKANAEAVAAVAELHRFQLETAATFAHELKNPLFAMQGLATLIRRRASREPELAIDLEALVAEVHRMTAAVTELLDFSRAIHPESLKRVPLLECVEAQLRTMTLVEPIVAIDPELVLMADPRKLERIIRALLRPGEKARLHAQAQLDGERIRLDVATAEPVDVDHDLELAMALAAQQGGELIVRRTPSFLATLYMPRHMGVLPGAIP